MKFSIVHCIIIIALLTSACKKSKTNTLFLAVNTETKPTETTEKIALPITKGSYWVYDVNLIDANTLTQTFVGRDSIVVEKDTIVNSKIFKVVRKYLTAGNISFQGITAQEGIYRDSAGYNVTPNGAFFNQNDFESTKITPTSGGTIESKLLHSGKITIASFEFLNSVNYLAKLEPLTLPYNGVRYLNNYFVSGIGLVKSSSFYLMDPNHYFEKTMIRYKIN